MSRWTPDQRNTRYVNEAGDHVSFMHCQYTDELFNAHNAACDAYEARITELEADIACAREELSIDPEQTFASGVESVCFQIKGLRAIEETLLADLARANARIAELDAVIARVNEIARQPLHMTSEAFERIEDLRHMLFRHDGKFGIVDGETEPYETEASIARADLARTRAESLRVVKVGEPGEWADFGGKFFQYNDRLWVEDERDPKSAWSLLPEHDCMELAWETIVQPVRLQRWEAGT